MIKGLEFIFIDTLTRASIFFSRPCISTYFLFLLLKFFVIGSRILLTMNNEHYLEDKMESEKTEKLQ